MPSPSYPEWERKSVATLTKYTDLYTSVRRGLESDDFERWLNETIEAPASVPLAKVRRNERMEPDDWHALIRYAAALDLRTPASYREMTARLEKQMPSVVHTTLAEAKREIARAARTGTALRSLQPATVERGLEPVHAQRRLPFPLRVHTSDVPGQDRVELKVEIAVGRELWLHTIQHAVEETSRVLLKHQWRIIRPPSGWEWFTSDNSVIRLNWCSPEKYDFDGGWDRERGEIFLPLSPTHMMYAMAGGSGPPVEVVSPSIATSIQRFVAQHAYRWIIATRPVRRVEWIRSRAVDRERFAEEEMMWKTWHAEQAAAECR